MFSVCCGNGKVPQVFKVEDAVYGLNGWFQDVLWRNISSFAIEAILSFNLAAVLIWLKKVLPLAFSKKEHPGIVIGGFWVSMHSGERGW